MKISKLTVENFRGIRLPITLEFEKNNKPTSVLIYGRNGTGKSSFVDAWEWLTKFEIEGLRKEGISVRDYAHKLSNGDNTRIQIDFKDAAIEPIVVKFNPSKITSPMISGDYDKLKSTAIYPNYLRYSDLQNFVYKTKTDKYKYIAKFFGLDEFLAIQSAIQGSTTRIKNQLDQVDSSLQESLIKLKQLTGNGTSAVEEQRIILLINEIAIRHEIVPIEKFTESKKVLKSLESIVNSNPIASELAQRKSFKTKFDNTYPLPDIPSEIEATQSSFDVLKRDEGNIAKLFLINLYELGIETISKQKDMASCPLCDKEFDGDLIEHIKTKHKAIQELNDKKKQFEKCQKSLEKSVTTLITKLSSIQNESSKIILLEFGDFFTFIAEMLKEAQLLLSEFSRPITAIPALSMTKSQLSLNFSKLLAWKSILSTKLNGKITSLENDPKSLALAKDFSNLTQVISNYIDYLKFIRKSNYLRDIVSHLENLSEKLTTFIQEQIQQTFDSIQTDVKEFYNFLEKSNSCLKDPEVKLVTGKDKAVELEIVFIDERISPAYKFMSESQVNSFGLAIFFAAVKHFNQHLKFIILDDVVNSFDAFKRPKVSQLISTKLSDYQLLMLTHDQIFFDTVQRDFPGWNRYKFSSWDYSTGPRYRLAKNYSEEIQEFLDDDNPILAGQSLGRYLEWTFGILNENMKTPIQYKLENVYTLAEFYDPLVKRFREKLKRPGYKHKLFNLFDAMDAKTIFRNYCAHYKNEASQFTTPEIDSIFKIWLEIEEMLYCPECKSFVQFDKNISGYNICCLCLKMNCLDDEYYEQLDTI